MPKKKRERTSELPDRIDDRVLGILRFSTALDDTLEYQAKLVLDGRPVTFDLYTDDLGALAPCIQRARRIVERFETIKVKMHRYIEREIFPSYNEIWRPDKMPFSLDQLLRPLKLDAVTTHPEPEATFWFDTGNLFLGHALQLRMAERNKFVDHDMPG